MKKFYLSAIILSAAFTACTQDDVVEMAGENNFKSRIALENVTFDTGVMSRFAFNDEGGVFNNYVPEKGDAVGAYLIDKIDGTIVTDENWDLALDDNDLTDLQREQMLLGGYSVVGNIQGAFKWTYNGSKYEPSDVMVEGNYLYVAPYQAKKTREPIITKIDQVQYLKYNEGTTVLNENSLLDALAESGYPVAIGYEFVSRYNDVINGQLRQIYAYPELTFNNTLDAAVTVQKVVLHSASKFAIEGKINIVNAQIKLNRLDSDPDALKESNIAGDWMKSTSGNYYKTTCETADLIDASKSVDFIVIMAPENLSVASGKSVTFRAVIPADAYVAGDLKIDVYTNKGVFRQTLGAITYNPGLRYSSANYTDGSLNKNLVDNEETELIDESINGYDATVGQETVTKISPVVVVNTEDLIAVINGAAEGTEASVNKIDVAPVADVVINNAVVAALGNKKGLNISQTVNVEGTESGITLKNIKFEKGAKVTTGKVTFGKNAKVQGTNTLEIANAANVILDESINNNGNAVVVNKGTLSINKVQTINNLTNEGTLTVNKIFTDQAQTVVGEVNLGNLVNGAASTTSASLIIANGAKAKVTALSGYGDVTISANATADLQGSSNGEITNEGNFKCTADFISYGEFTNNGAFDGLSNFINDGTFYNNLTTGVITIKQNGVTTTGDLDDSALIVPVAGSMTKVNHNYGTIKYVVGALLAETENHGDNPAGHKRYGHVEYTFEGSDSEALATAYPNYCTKLVLTKDFEIKKAKAIELEGIKVIDVKGGMITINEDQKLYNCPLFVSGNATLAGSKALYTNSRFVVDQTATLTIFAGKVGGWDFSTNTAGDYMTFENNGTVNNFGKVVNTNHVSYMTKKISSTWTSVWNGNAFDEIH